MTAGGPRAKQLIPEKQGQALSHRGEPMTFRSVLVSDQLTKGQLLAIAERAMADLIRDREFRARVHDLKQELENTTREVKTAEAAHDGLAGRVSTR